MRESQLTWHAAAGSRRWPALAEAEPSADLWLRILQRHAADTSRRRRRRHALRLGVAALALAAIGLAAWLAPLAPDSAPVDWQARAQALELRLHAVERSADPAAARSAALLEDELVRLDARLQAAYDHGAERQQQMALWKRRSELLDALLRARQNDIHISRI
jgi:hypothetical protein